MAPDDTGTGTDDTGSGDSESSGGDSDSDSDSGGETGETGEGCSGYADLDGDGYGDEPTTDCDVVVATGGDCDDADDGVNPGAAETCDGVDEDCDGEIDEDPSSPETWFADGDGDGYGDPATGTRACTVPTSYVLDDTDCDDTNAAINPGVLEICDAGVDDDCDGLSDDADPDLDGSTTSAWYADVDLDGYGDDLAVSAACASPTGALASGGDCDDADAGVHPGADETCDEVDQDCDGEIDEDAIDGTSLHTDDDGDGYGDASTSVVACDGEGMTADGSDCDDADGEVHPGAYDRCDNGKDDDCAGGDETDCALSTSAGLSSTYDTRIYGKTKLDYVGALVVGPGDVNGDGYDDLLVSATGYDSSYSSGIGQVAVLYGPLASGDIKFADSDLLISGGSASDALATAAAALGDMDSDGIDDYALASPAQDGGGTGSGRVYVVDGSTSRSGTTSVGSASLTVTGEEAGDALGSGVAGCDLDDDGVPDLVMGASGYGSGDAGAVYVVSGYRSSGSADASDADVRIVGKGDGDQLGASVACGGDIDGDGSGDLAVAATGSDDGASGGGAVWVIPGPLGAHASNLARAPMEVVGASASDALGAAMAMPGDTNADGYDDLLVGAPQADPHGSGSGAAYLLRGPLEQGVGQLTDEALELDGGAAGDAAGTSVGGAGDIDADGYADVLIGMPGSDSGYTDAGTAYIFYGPLADGGTSGLSSADATLRGPSASDAAGTSVAVVGDLDGDGYDDLAVGGSNATYGSTDAGIAWVLLGGAATDGDVGEASPPDQGTDDDGDGYSEAEGDCDDTRDGFSPATADTCGDGLDQDCSGVDPSCAPSGSVALSSVTWGSFSASSFARAGDVDGDGYDDLLIGNAGDDSAASNAGAALLRYGPVGRGSYSTALGDVALRGVAASDGAGGSVAGDADVDGDAVPDLLIGATGCDSGVSGGGCLYVVYGSSALDAVISLADADAIIAGTDASTNLGSQVALGDVDGDGHADVFTSSPSADGDTTDQGAVLGWSGATLGGVLSASDLEILGENPSDALGGPLYVGDMDGDGTGVLALRAAANDDGGSGTGKVYAIRGSWTAGASVDAAYLRLDRGGALEEAASFAQTSGSGLGTGLAGGDLDADGYQDLVMGTSGATAWVSYGPLHPDRRAMDEEPGTRITLDGTNVTAATIDMNGDGYTDLALGDPTSDVTATNAGGVYIWLGPIPAGSVLTTGGADIALTGTTSSYVGTSLINTGDITGDGYEDLLVGNGSAGTSWALVPGGWSTDTPVAPTYADPASDADGDGWTGEGGDCDDTRAEVSPDDAEVCGDGLDDDCDGRSEPCAPSSTIDMDDLGAAVDNTGGLSYMGWAVAIVGDVNGDGWTDYMASSPGDDGVLVNSGTAFLWLGPIHRGTVAAKWNDGEFTADSGIYSMETGDAITSGDVDGDGYDDILIGTGEDTTTGYPEAFLYLGGPDIADDHDLKDEDTGFELGSGQGGYYSHNIALADLDGDGYDDVILTASYSAGSVSVWYGPVASGTLAASSADLIFKGVSYYDYLGMSVANLGDVDGDGAEDLLIGSYGAPTSGSRAGRAYVWYGRRDSGTYTITDVADVTIEGAEKSDFLGWCVAGPGDLDGDGVPDLLVGAPHAAPETGEDGALYLYSGASLSSSMSTADATLTFVAADGSSQFSRSCGVAGDMNGDGARDLVVTAETSAGLVWLFYGPFTDTGIVDVSGADATVEGGTYDRAGEGLSDRSGDLDGDGYDDLPIGGWSHGLPTSSEGRFGVLFGGM